MTDFSTADERVEPTLGSQAAAFTLSLTDDDRISPMASARKPRGGRAKANGKKKPAKSTARGRGNARGSGKGGAGGRGGGRATRRKGEKAQGSLLGRAVRGLAYWSFVGVLITGGLGAAVVGYSVTQLPSVESWTVPPRAANVRVLAANGTLISNRADTSGVALTLDDLPPYMPQALMAIEDRRFYWHFGIDPIGLTRAMVTNAREGRVVQGGSTITQQLAKNLFLKPERTVQRKLQEVVLALWLEARLSKKEILELYLNRVYFGSGAYGVDAAAHRFFGKSARYMTLAEAATLAGLLKAPSTYSPISNPQASASRTQTVLAAMHDAGFINAREATLALGTDTRAVDDVAAGSGRYVVDWVLDQLPGYVGALEEDIIVTTTIDLRLQDAAARAISTTLAEAGAEKGVEQGALVAIDTAGAVRALVGGRDYAESQYNRAVDARRQPGSAFKPFVYLTALEHGLVPESVRIDQPVSIDGWRPENYAKDYRGPVTLQTGLALSLNTISAQLADEFGPGNVAATARRLGITSSLTETPSIALGTSEVSPLELTAAYVPFSNGGRGVIPHVIRRIETAHGEVLYERSGSGLGQVIDPTQVGMMNAMLADTLIRGTGKKAQIAGWPAAGKTGTSQDFRDAWFIGYTGVLTAGVWFGNDDNSPTDRASGGNIPTTTWQRFMTEALDGVVVADLPGAYISQPDLAPDFDIRTVAANGTQADGAPIALIPDRDRPRRYDRPGLLQRLFGG